MPFKEMLDWDKVFTSDFGFEIQVQKATAKRKHVEAGIGQQDSYFQASPFDRRANFDDYLYTVAPSQVWYRMDVISAYEKLDLEGQHKTRFEAGQYIYIQPDERQESDKQAQACIDNWVAIILEIRRAPPQRPNEDPHVFLRIYYMYRPEDLRMNRQSYHGRNEVIASDEMAIVDVETVNDLAHVIYYSQDSDEDIALAPYTLFYRQTLVKSRNRQTLSPQRLHALSASRYLRPPTFSKDSDTFEAPVARITSSPEPATPSPSNSK